MPRIVILVLLDWPNTIHPYDLSRAALDTDSVLPPLPSQSSIPLHTVQTQPSNPEEV